MLAEDRRRERWKRFEPFDSHLQHIVPEIADDLDDHDMRWEKLERRIDRLTAVATGLLVSMCTGVFLMALNLIAVGGK